MARDSSGSQNQPQYSSAGAPSDAADLSEVANYAAAVGNQKFGTASARAALTGADLWNGLEFHETDTGCSYVYFGGAWVLDRIIGLVKDRIARLTADNVASATTLGTLALPSMPVATRIAIEANGLVGFGTAGATFGVDITTSAGTLTLFGTTTITVSAGVFAGYAQTAYLDLPATTAVTLTFKTNSSISGYYRLGATARVLLPGQY